MTDSIVEPFYIIGISTRTSNEEGKATKDIPELWASLMSGEAAAAIPGILGQDIYCVYTEYESDYTRPYTVVLGYKVASLDIIPEGYKGITIGGGSYRKVTAEGNIAEGIVFNAWLKIWSAGWNRAYTTDFEVYGAKAQNPMNAEVDIFIAVKEEA